MMVHDDWNAQHRMNEALDQTLSEEELAELQAQFESAPEVEQEWDQLRRTDELFRTTPQVGPSAGFAKRVMEAIAALPLPGFAKRELSVGLALGLAAAAALALPVLVVALFLLIGAVTNPGTISTLLEASINAMSFVVGLAADVAAEVRSWISGSPALGVLLVLVVPLSIIWGWMLWALLSGRELVIRRTRL